MRYLLDSDIVTDLYDKSAANHRKIAGRLAALDDTDEVCISILTVYEFEYGLANAPEDKRDAIGKKVAEAQNDFEVLPLSSAGAKSFGMLKRALKDRRALTHEGAKKHNIDLIIAATALAEGCTLVSADAVYREFQTTHPDLTLEDWV
jgi:predicted nucleic acid-binding protein